MYLLWAITRSKSQTNKRLRSKENSDTKNAKAERHKRRGRWLNDHSSNPRIATSSSESGQQRSREDTETSAPLPLYRLQCQCKGERKKAAAQGPSVVSRQPPSTSSTSLISSSLFSSSQRTRQFLSLYPFFLRSFFLLFGSFLLRYLLFFPYPHTRVSATFDRILKNLFINTSALLTIFFWCTFRVFSYSSSFFSVFMSHSRTQNDFISSLPASKNLMASTANMPCARIEYTARSKAIRTAYIFVV